MDILTLIACVTGVLVSVVLLLVGLDVLSKKSHSKQSFGQALRHYVSINALSLLGKIYRNKLIRATHKVADAQTAFLLSQLKENGDTEYGKRYDFGTVTSVREFQVRHPLTRYDHYAPYVQKMTDGEKGVLTRQQPALFGVSSGTSGEGNKIIPTLKKQQTTFFLHAVSVLYCCMVETFPSTAHRLRKSLKIFYNPTWRTSKAGVKIGPNSSTPSRQQSVLHMYTTPLAGFEILSEPDALYVHLLFALKDRHLGMIEGNFASLVYNAVTTLHRCLVDLLSDIRHGTLNAKLNVDPSVRARLEKLLQPDPARADEIQKAFDEGGEGAEGVCGRVWPELCMVLTVDSGTFTPYADKLRETYLKGIPLYSPLYAATEGLVGINLWPGDSPSRYLPHPCVQFFEFIPVECSDLEQPETVLLHQVQEGKEYELVLTNISGLYRYRLGDVVRVTGFLNQCPIFEFLYRMGQFLNVRGEKTSEALFYTALKDAVAQWSGLALVDYCCAESILLDDVISENKSTVPRYHVFLELEGMEEQDLLSEDQKTMIDDFLCQKSYVYSSFRKKGSIDVTQVHVLRHGAFHQLRSYVIKNTDASSNQFKVPRVLKHKPFVDFLHGQVLP
ncbi:uncharacterized protein [Littorina saxatilis]|uniref:GH3 domain-containing protein n=1 Tax=Littorina saxatilis TaxID=31220 RepID=A0AAN9B2X3_9CAEN